MAGKGDKPRPIVKKEYDKNFDSIKWNGVKNTNSIKSKNKIIFIYK
jgi:hypothetical protein